MLHVGVGLSHVQELYQGKEEQVPELRRLVNALPPENATLLEFLISFFKYV
jgi:hypothetical protein